MDKDIANVSVIQTQFRLTSRSTGAVTGWLDAIPEKMATGEYLVSVRLKVEFTDGTVRYTEDPSMHTYTYESKWQKFVKRIRHRRKEGKHGNRN